MSQQANPTRIGFFVLGALAIAIFAVAFFGGGEVFEDKEKFVLYFEGSVNGLIEGSPVKFKGVPVGEVEDIRIRYNQGKSSNHIPVIIQIDSKKIRGYRGKVTKLDDGHTLSEQIKFGLRGHLEFQSLVTGVLFIELDYHKDAGPPVYIQEGDTEYPEIPTISSEFGEVGEDIKKIAVSVSKFDFEGISKKTDKLLTKLDKIDVDEFNKLLTSADDAFVQVTQLSKEMENSLNIIVKDIDESAVEMKSTFKEVRQMFEPQSTFRYEFRRAMTEIARAAEYVGLLADYLERNPNALLSGKMPPPPAKPIPGPEPAETKDPNAES